jgi:hypothetical protein
MALARKITALVLNIRYPGTGCDTGSAYVTAGIRYKEIVEENNELRRDFTPGD